MSLLALKINIIPLYHEHFAQDSNGEKLLPTSYTN